MGKLQIYLAEKNIESFVDEDGNEYIWKKHAAAGLNKNEKTLERRADAGKIKQIDNDGKAYYLRTDLETYEKELQSAVHKAVVDTDTTRPTQTDSTAAGMMQMINPDKNILSGASFTPDMASLQQQYVAFMTERTEFEAKRAYFQCNVTFVLTEVAERFNLSIVHLRDNAKTFKGKNQKLMITKKNLESYLEKL